MDALLQYLSRFGLQHVKLTRDYLPRVAAPWSKFERHLHRIVKRADALAHDVEGSGHPGLDGRKFAGCIVVTHCPQHRLPHESRRAWVTGSASGFRNGCVLLIGQAKTSRLANGYRVF